MAPGAPQHGYPALRDFGCTHADTIWQQLTTRINQTNEVGRCAYLMPAFTLISRLDGGRPLAIVEIGTSAGLNLMWDYYGYQYDTMRCGNLQSPVQITCALRGRHCPPRPDQIPEIRFKIGVDLHIVDIRDAEEALWQRALVWPQHCQRAT